MVAKKEKFRFYRPFDSRSFRRDRCFLCGRVTGGSRSQEHVFPKWLLSRCDLWDERLILLNKSDIPYRLLKIPCCTSCNTRYLSKLESEVAARLEGGYEDFRNIDESTLFYWLSKIFFGLHFKEVLLPAKRKENRKTEGILHKDTLSSFRMVHLFLQGARVPIEFVGFAPWSIFIFECKVSPNVQGNFDYRDSLLDATVAMRMHDVGVVAVLQDNGTQKEMLTGLVKHLETIRLHPLQFEELVAITTYWRRLLNRTPLYSIAECGDRVIVHSFPLQGLSTIPVFDKWEPETYARHLSIQVGKPFESLFVPPDRVVTWLQREDGSPNDMCGDSEYE